MKTNLLTAPLLALPLVLCAPACLFDVSGELGAGCSPEDEDYPDCLPLDAGSLAPPADGSWGDRPASDGEIIVRRADYRGALCESGAGVRIVVGSDNDGDGALNTEMDGSRCVALGEALGGRVGVAFCLDALTCLSWGVEFDANAGIGVRLCFGRDACLALGVEWRDGADEARLCWDPRSDASVPSDEILHEEIVCQPPMPCGEAGACAGDLVCRGDLCVVDRGDGDPAGDGGAAGGGGDPGAP